MDIYKEALELHKEFNGKLGVQSKVSLNTPNDLSLIYTPGVAEVSRAVANNQDDIYKYTMKSNTVAVISNGTAVLGLGNIGAHASLPVMEGKATIFKRFANVDAFPVCIDATDVDEFVNIVKKISVSFGAINLEDIAAPACFEIEKRLIEELDIPVFHDDQHGTAIALLGAFINALKLKNMKAQDAKVVLSGAGAAGITVAKILLQYGVKDIVVLDSKGILHPKRSDIVSNKFKLEIAKMTNPNGVTGDLSQAVIGADFFIGVSAPNILTADMVKSMAKDPVIFAMANPHPEILPDVALDAGAFIVGTGRSDFPNQINNALVFPGIFRAILDERIPKVTENMKIIAAEALADSVRELSPSNIIPSLFDEYVPFNIANAIKELNLKNAQN